MKHILRRLSHPAFRAYSQAARDANRGVIRATSYVLKDGVFPGFTRQCASAKRLDCPPSHSLGCEEFLPPVSRHWAYSVALIGLSVSAAISAGAVIAADGHSPSGLPGGSSGRSAQNSETAADGLPAGFIEALREAVGRDNVVLDDDERLSHAKQWNTCYPVKRLPSAVVYPG